MLLKLETVSWRRAPDIVYPRHTVILAAAHTVPTRTATYCDCGRQPTVTVDRESARRAPESADLLEFPYLYHISLLSAVCVCVDIYKYIIPRPHRQIEERCHMQYTCSTHAETQTDRRTGREVTDGEARAMESLRQPRRASATVEVDTQSPH